MHDDKICNKCGQSCSINLTDKYDNYGLIDARVSGGYMSPIFDDCTSYKFSLCESCLVDLFDSFVHPPIVHNVSVWECEDLQEEKYISLKKCV